MTSAPTVSVITISMHDLEGLKRTVDSVRAQRYGGHIEHIVIDGGSGDDVVEYLSGCEPGFTYWQSEPDGGRYDAMNQGIAHASGDLLWFMHSSDRFSDPDAVAQVVEAISGHGPAREVWGYGMDYLIGPGRAWGPMPFNIRKFLAGWQVVPHQASFFGSSLVSKLSGYDLDFGIAADQEFIFRAALLREPITIRRVVCDFDTSGVGSNRPPREVFGDLRRLWDLHGCYPLGGRWTSLAYLRSWEYYERLGIRILALIEKIGATAAQLMLAAVNLGAASSAQSSTKNVRPTLRKGPREAISVNRFRGRRCRRPATFDHCGDP